MTYCLGIQLEEGLVCVSDSRTNAGVDHVSRFEKMRVFANGGDRAIAVLSAGNLSVTQSVLSLLEERHRTNPEAPSFWNASSMYDIAGMLGKAMREIQRRDGDYMRQNNIDASASFVVGGQIGGERTRLFMIYTEGNFIESGQETNYFQIGEIKYGKPILDRVLRPDLSLSDAVKCALISFDSTMRSNISVGPPLHVFAYRNDSLIATGPVVIDEGDHYYEALRTAWADGLRSLFDTLQPPHWL